MDEMDEILREVDSHSIYSLNKDIPDNKFELIHKAITRGYVIKSGRFTCQISTLGEKIVRSGIGWEAWERTSAGQISSFHIGHNITGSTINQSDLSNDLRNFSNMPPNITHPKKSKFTSIFTWIVANIWYIISGVLITSIGAYIAYIKGW